MLIISDIQMEQMQNAKINSFIDRAKKILINSGNESIIDSDIKMLVNDAFGANIRSEQDVFEYIKLAMLNNELMEKPMPDWLKNILYLNANPAAKIDKIGRILCSKQKDYV